MAAHLAYQHNNRVEYVRKVIIFPAGENARMTCNDMQIDEVSYVIDNHKAGQETVLFGRKYEIDPVEILNNIDSAEYSILIASERYEAELEDQIKKQYPTWHERIVSSKEIEYVYDTLYEAINYDNRALRMICKSNISLLVHKYAEEVVSAFRNLNIQIKGYSICRKGECHLICRALSDTGEYMIRFPSRTRNRMDDLDHIKEIYEIRKDLGVNKGIIIYENEDGLGISKRCRGLLDWDDKNLNVFLNQIRRIHNSGCETKYHTTGILRPERSIDVAPFYEAKDLILNEIIKWLRDEVDSYLLRDEVDYCFIHGDLHLGNILADDDGDIEVIDWDLAGMGDRLYDITRFAVSLEKSHRKYPVEKVVRDYLRREPDRNEAIRIQMITAKLYFYEYCFFLTRNRDDGNCYLNRLIELYNNRIGV